MKRTIFALIVFVLAPLFAQAQELVATRTPPAYAWANRPTCGTAGDRFFATDIGIGGSGWVCDGTEWHPSAVIVLGRSAAPITDTSGSTEFNMAVVTVPGGVMGTNGALEAEALYAFTGSTNSKSLSVRLATTSGAISGGIALIFSTTVTAANIAFRARNFVRNRNSASSQVAPVFGFATVLGFGNSAASTGALNTANPVYVNFNAIKATAGETMTLESYEVRLIP